MIFGKRFSRHNSGKFLMEVVSRLPRWTTIPIGKFFIITPLYFLEKVMYLSLHRKFWRLVHATPQTTPLSLWWHFFVWFLPLNVEVVSEKNIDVEKEIRKSSIGVNKLRPFTCLSNSPRAYNFLGLHRKLYFWVKGYWQWQLQISCFKIKHNCGHTIKV